MQYDILWGADGFLGRYLVYAWLRNRHNNEARGLLLWNANLTSFLSHPEVPDDLRDLDPASCTTVSTIGSWAALADFAEGSTFRVLYAQQDAGAISALEQSKNLVQCFSYVGDVAVFGQRDDVISDDFLGRYAASDAFGQNKDLVNIEVGLLQKAVFWNQKLQVMRIGQLMGPYYYGPKVWAGSWDIVYAWTKFFWVFLQNNKIDHMRIYANPSGGLNVLPVDYVAEAIWRAVEAGTPQVNIVNSMPWLHTSYLAILLHAIFLSQYSLVDQVPSDPLGAEALYYASVGAKMQGFLGQSIQAYDTKIIRGLMSDIPEPDLLSYLRGHIQAAIAKDFKP